MISASRFISTIQKAGFTFFTGVPDGSFRNLIAAFPPYTTMANEGSAIAYAAGYHIATNKTPVVFIQNPGLGNAVDPLTSLTNEDMFQVPMLLLIGWRGQPGVEDGIHQRLIGSFTLNLLENMQIPHIVIDDDNWKSCIENAKRHFKEKSTPYAIVIPKGTFEPMPQIQATDMPELSREEVIRILAKYLDKNDITVTIPGKLTKELRDLKKKMNIPLTHDLLAYGAMGHAGSLALGLAEQSKKRIWCLDGDGSAIMHLGSLATIGAKSPKNLIHIIFNNGVFQTTGNQPTTAPNLSFTAIADVFGYKHSYIISTKEELEEFLKEHKKDIGPLLVEIKINSRARAKFGPVETIPPENKKLVMHSIRSK
jgi:phosphonopyruvate decarboxylase